MIIIMILPNKFFIVKQHFLLILLLLFGLDVYPTKYIRYIHHEKIINLSYTLEIYHPSRNRSTII